MSILPEVGSRVRYHQDIEMRRSLSYPKPYEAIVKRVHEKTRSVDIEMGGFTIANVPVDQRTPDSPTEFDPRTHWCEICAPPEPLYPV
jgi:hypothetical protein